MDFLDPKKRRRHTIQLFTGYILVAIAILLATTILVYYAYGFGVTRQGDLVQKGLVFVSSQPSGAELYVSGKRVNNTNTKLNLAAGSYTLDIKRNGYRDWHRSIEVEGGSVDHFVYPFLFPKELKPQTVKNYDSTPQLTTQSPDRRWLVVRPGADKELQFDVFDLSRNQDEVGTPLSFTIPQTLVTASATPAQWEALEWSNNNRHILFKRTYSEGQTQKAEYILVDRQRPEGSYNLSREFAIDAETTDITLLDKKPDAYYIHNRSTGALARATLDNRTPENILSDVTAYKSHGSDVIVYTTAKDAPEGTVTAKLLYGEKEYTLRNLAASDTYLLNAARFDGDWYIVAGSQAENRVFIYKDPVAQINGNKDKKAGAQFSLRVDKPVDVSFSANAQFIALQNGKSVHVYDIDHEAAYRYKLRYSLEQPQVKMAWMDGNRFTYASNGKQVAFDYDNSNPRTLVPASSTYESAFDRNYEYLYTFTSRSDGQAGISLNATPLRTENDL